MKTIDLIMLRMIQISFIMILVMGLILTQGNFSWDSEYIFGTFLVLASITYWLFQDFLFEEMKKKKSK